MRMFLTFSPIFLMMACGDVKDTSSTGGSDSPDNDLPTCDISVNVTYPEDGSTDHYYLDPIRFILSDPDGSAEIFTDIPGTQSTDAGGRTIVYTPDEPLAPNTSYSIGLDYCYGNPEIEFSTSSYGAPVDSDVQLEDKTFALDLTSGDYTVGESAGELLNALFTRHVLFQLEEIEGDELSVVVAVSKPNDSPIEQDLCGRTLSLDGVDISQMPYFSLDLRELVFGAHDGELRFTQFSVNGTISPDGSRIGGISFVATMAVDEISHVLPDVGGVEALCQIADNLGIPCAACPTDEFALCITVAAEHILARDEDVMLQEVAEAGQADDCE